MSMLIRFLFFFVLFHPGLCAEAEELDPGKQDNLSQPGTYQWTITNDCNETIMLAVHYAPESTMITKGWWILKRGKSKVFTSNTEFVGYYAKSESHLWRGYKKDDDYFLAIDSSGNDFEFEGSEPPTDLESAYFRRRHLEPEFTTLITCSDD